MTKTWRVIDSLPEDAYTNMAIDEAITLGGELPTLRFYRWKNSCISFGYGQRIRDVLDNFSVPEVVRRPTGGGIVIHGVDVTYSVILYEDNPFLPKGLSESYCKIHECIIKALKIVDIEAKHHIEKVPEAKLCFSSPVQYDVLVDGRKVAGGAQRRKEGVILYQGSMIINIDIETIKRGFEEIMGVEIVIGKLTKSELANARTLCHTKYRTKKWNYKR